MCFVSSRCFVGSRYRATSSETNQILAIRDGPLEQEESKKAFDSCILASVDHALRVGQRNHDQEVRLSALLKNNTVKFKLAARNYTSCRETVDNTFEWVAEAASGRPKAAAHYRSRLTEARQGAVGFRSEMVNAARCVNMLRSELDCQVPRDIENTYRQLNMEVSRDMMTMISRNPYTSGSGMLGFHIDMTGPVDVVTSEFPFNSEWRLAHDLPRSWDWNRGAPREPTSKRVLAGFFA